MISSVVSESAETVYAHRKGHSVTRVHKTRHKRSGRSRKASHPKRRKAKKRVTRRKAPRRRKKAAPKRHRRAAPKRHKRKSTPKRRKALRRKKTSHRRKAPKKRKSAHKKKSPKKKKHKKSSKKKSSSHKKKKGGFWSNLWNKLTGHKKTHKKASKKHSKSHKKKKGHKKSHKKSHKKKKGHKKSHKKKKGHKKSHKKSHKKKKGHKKSHKKSHKKKNKFQSFLKKHETAISIGLAAASVALAFINPFAAAALDMLLASGDLYSAISGHSAIGGRKLSTQERILDAVFAVIGFAGAAKAIKGVFLKKVGSSAAKKESKNAIKNRIKKNIGKSKKVRFTKVDKSIEAVGKNENNVHHVLQTKHNWKSVAKTNNWREVSKVMKKVMQKGKESVYKVNSYGTVYKRQLRINGKNVIVTYIKKNGTSTISDGWVGK